MLLGQPIISFPKAYTIMLGGTCSMGGLLFSDFLHDNPTASILFSTDENLESLDSLAYSLYKKDPYTYHHSKNVACMSLNIAKSLGLDKNKQKDVLICAFLHDIGKIGIEDHILKKNDKLTDDEYSIIKTHSILGEEIILSRLGIKNFADIVRHHHEKYDGSGYPDKLSGVQIPLESRIIAVADTYDAMSTRAYSKPKSKAESINEIKSNIGTQFDTEIASEFISFI